MIKVVLSYMHYPVTIARYFHESLLQRDDVEVLSVGPYTGTSIPWNGGMQLPITYVRPPDITIPPSFLGNNRTPPGLVEIKLREKGFEPDLWININAGFGFMRTKLPCQVANVFTDGHVLENQFYKFARTQADINFNMHQHFSQPGDRVLPYAASEIYHYPEEREKVTDVCLIGLHYNERNMVLNALQRKGLKVDYDIGPAYDDYRERYTQSRVAFSWSSKGDLIARVFEAMAMAVPLVTDRVPDLPTHFVEDEHYKGFSNGLEAEKQIQWCLDNPEDAQEMADRAHRKVYAQHLYKFRVGSILRECKLI